MQKKTVTKPYSKFPGVEPSERDDLVKFTAEKLKAQSDELLYEFCSLVGQEKDSLGSLAAKSYKLIQMFEYDTETFSNEVQNNVRTLMEFQRDFDAIEKNFHEIEEMNRKSRQMKGLV